ncbi:MAG: hypothetical protein KKB21_01735 [Nanoarchaeota archaeon]|nr:hypothetical protein [Nanoarchaeota archaeon]
MEKEMIGFIAENKLSGFELVGKIRRKDKSIFITSDAKSVFNRTLEKLNSKFVFSDTENLWNLFTFTSDINEIKKRQEFFGKLERKENSFLKDLSRPRKWWKPKYSLLVVSEDEKTFQELQKLDVPCKFLNSQYDLQDLESYDLVQVIDCDQFTSALERLPQSVFLDSLDEVYLERYLELLSGWQKNLEILARNETSEEIKKITGELVPMLKFLENKSSEKIEREQIDSSLEKVNLEVNCAIEKMSISGASLIAMMSKNKLPDDIVNIIEQAIKKTNLPEHLFSNSVPVALDEKEVEKLMKEQNASEHTTLAENVKKKASELRKIPAMLKKLSDLIVYFDFCSGTSQIISENRVFPEQSLEFSFSEAENIFLDSPQAISFSLDDSSRCSILTGANSGGKTTLIEHIIQMIGFFQLGLPVKGKTRMPLFSEIYYFAKNKGSASKGAFETLLTQMASIKPGSKTLILADEIESVTEPGVAGKIISATAEFFVSKGCFLVIATHLGQEVQKNMPCNSRIDGIEAKGLDENFELIVDHNPVLGKLANSTPELIIEKMSKNFPEEYFKFLNERIRIT